MAASCYRQAVALLAARAHFRRELETKLLRRGFGDQEVEEALDRLATSMVMTAEAVQEWAGEPTPEALAPDARALRWHLYHLATRIRGAREACPDARRWARELLIEAPRGDAHERAG